VLRYQRLTRPRPLRTGRQGDSTAGAEKGDPSGQRGPAALRRALPGLALVLGPIAMLAIGIWLARAEPHLVKDLPTEQRRALYADALRAFETLCGSPRVEPAGSCRERARLLRSFPECDRECHQATLPSFTRG
jgi:hypothetical protein